MFRRAPRICRFQSTLPVWGATWFRPMSSNLRVFQSTLPVWGATSSMLPRRAKRRHFNPRSPCGERQQFGSDGGDSFYNFNPRSPCGERLPVSVNNLCITIFQSTLPVWGATKNKDRRQSEETISIHAPRVGSDREDGRKL